ncbi:MAG: hypothetical protein IPO21_12390 [Bacteroidales bacterium]|nr:hypothetical protein [Bacteroidales bacterium]
MLKSYSSTQRVKIVVFIFAVLLGVGILFLLLNIIENVKKEERNKIMLWAGAIQKKIELVEYTNKLFEKLKEDERTKVEIWSGAMRQIMDEENSDNLTFLLKIISTNKNIPIMTNTKGKIVSHVNLDIPPIPESFITDSLYADFAFYEPIAVTYNNEILNYLYYQDSKLFTELQLVMNNMVRNFISEVVLNSASVPVVITDSLRREIIAFGNIDSTLLSDSVMLRTVLSKMESVNTPIRLHWFENETFYIFYEDSFLLNMLKYYPAAFMLIVILFLIIVYMAFRASRKYEQNQLWVGMSKRRHIN